MTAVSQPPEAPAPKGGASPHLIYEITSDDGFSIKSQSIEDAWQKLVDSIQEARSNARMKQLSYSALSGADLFGLTNATVMYLIEQLYGAHKCKQYFFRYICYTHDDDDIEPDINPSGSARSEGFSSRKPFEMFSFLLSKYRPFPKTSAKVDRLLPQLGSSRYERMPSQDLPMAMRFRYLKEDARDNVVVYRSLIHGRGLFSIRDFDVGEMIIEYAGMVIRSSLTDSREKYYETKGIGCYMFRIDDHFVIDATVNGNAARFINHSCDPNCFSRVIDVSGVKHIIIFALKAVKAGEELTYDYKFPYEDVKIPCTCQAKRCRKYLN
ncbi:hypothetical protein CAPTEDRAFT_179499 [Capitella teleta]|uniref:Histone-lysine N-methyltransferase n=1 Tax=Capitella teleta TaxID=283909 RepID=R7UYP7_CAPTE|nr:hypothetical protein CAPTEDRAFT_179499 [Capitella teleta]|eukprot:ELU11678.1 hypothetical protein CAPTEDRAFT_179499 [Capitella teleta]